MERIPQDSEFSDFLCNQAIITCQFEPVANHLIPGGSARVEILAKFEREDQASLKAIRANHGQRHAIHTLAVINHLWGIGVVFFLFFSTGIESIGSDVNQVVETGFLSFHHGFSSRN